MKNTNHSLFDKYEMIKDLGTGSSGSVTLVRHISMDQERALKKFLKLLLSPNPHYQKQDYSSLLSIRLYHVYLTSKRTMLFTISSRNISTARH